MWRVMSTVNEYWIGFLKFSLRLPLGPQLMVLLRISCPPLPLHFPPSNERRSDYGKASPASPRSDQHNTGKAERVFLTKMRIRRDHGAYPCQPQAGVPTFVILTLEDIADRASETRVASHVCRLKAKDILARKHM